MEAVEMVGGNIPERAYAYIENWWGEELSPKLIERITSAPLDHLIAFEEGWPPSGVSSEQSVPMLQRGKLRPVYPPFQQIGHVDPGEIRAALKGLLLMESVVIDQLWFEPFRWFNHGYESAITSRADFPDEWPDDLRRLLPARLHDMLSLRPLVQDGSITVTNMRLNSGNHEDFERILRITQTIEQELRAIPNLWSPQPENRDGDDLTYVARRIAIPLMLAREGRATILQGSPFYEKLWAKLLGGLRVADGRISRVDKLFRLESPRLDGQLANLIAIRQNNDAFANFRSALSTALDIVAQVPETESGRLDAEAVVNDVLRSELQAVQAAVGKSPSLTALRDGTSRLVISGVGLAAGVGAAGSTGSLAAGAAAAGGGAAATAIQRYVQAASERRSHQRLWDFVVFITRAE